ncbi:aminotransferase class I/II-fold pyridoxal phosphate-dependent enzyme [Cellulomonas sp. JZ18]|uniref:DegT/DnrJ/EryC1/StrS family aminotransferase n=1 Tax=Cellulomonas sp. JZ18 TaxID=2654191 RepID=UPI0012D42B7F|nr:DegT/DnrJ/EryC1/StrS family aminotransferase [Cellulomonas sp. JZ18]QGQ18893.1 aminotransferase class I/II-fold pyridoxal phosphate-dependent enzyme [Cellulomonas sp. JZ18]
MSTNVIPAAKPLIGDEERAAVDRVMRTGVIAQGPEVAAFEREFADHLVEGRSCVAVSSGTTGLHLGLLAAGIGPGDEVIVPSFTFAATANSVALTGATPVFADIDPATYCLDPASVASVITERTAAIMPVHLYGHPADMTALGALAQEHGLQLFEDAAQAHGARWQGHRVGTFGTFAMFSLYPTKNMTSGEGGMVSCATPEVVRSVQLLRNQGMERRYENEVVGFNARMTDIHAAIGRVQLGKLDAWTRTRQENARYLSERLEGVGVPVVADGAEHVWHQYTIRVEDDRDGFAAALLSEHGVGSGVYYPIPNHELPSFGLTLDLPATRQACDQVLSLPVHPALTEADLDRVVEAVNATAKAGA